MSYITQKKSDDSLKVASFYGETEQTQDFEKGRKRNSSA
jgi:hypothetical protein